MSPLLAPSQRRVLPKVFSLNNGRIPILLVPIDHFNPNTRDSRAPRAAGDAAARLRVKQFDG